MVNLSWTDMRFRKHDTLNLEPNVLQKQKTTSGSTPVIPETKVWENISRRRHDHGLSMLPEPKNEYYTSITMNHKVLKFGSIDCRLIISYQVPSVKQIISFQEPFRTIVMHKGGNKDSLAFIFVFTGKNDQQQGIKGWSKSFFSNHIQWVQK